MDGGRNSVGALNWGFMGEEHEGRMKNSLNVKVDERENNGEDLA